MNKCDVCGEELVEDALFCTNCGALKCKTCGRFNPRENDYCENCGGVLKKESTNKTQIGNVDKDFSLNNEAMRNFANGAMDKSAEAFSSFVQETYTNIKGQQEERLTSFRKDNFVMLTDGEVIIRRYLITKLISPKIEGWLTVTNKRMVFHGKSYGSKIVNEVPIDSDGAIMTFYGHNIKFLLLIVGILFCFYSLLAMNDNDFGGGFGLILLAIGCILIFFSIKRTFNFEIGRAHV